jgi:signal peptidase II
MRRWAFWVTAGTVVALDQAVKALVEAVLPYGRPQPVIPGVLWFTHVHNPGVAFGQLAGAGWVLVALALGAAAFILGYRARLLRQGELPAILTFGLALPLGGALGNAIDRVRIGKVVDFFDLGWFPVFNVADSAITVGAGLLLLYFLVLHRPPAPEPPAPEPAGVWPASGTLPDAE